MDKSSGCPATKKDQSKSQHQNRKRRRLEMKRVNGGRKRSRRRWTDRDIDRGEVGVDR